MIGQNHKVSMQNLHSKFELDQKKLVKAFVYNNKNEWIEYFTGFLFMDTDSSLQNINIKIRFSRHPHINELHPKETFPLDILTDQQSLYTLINEEKIKTIEKPEQKLLYLKIEQEGKIIALSFQSKAYCNTILEHFSLMLESRNQNDQVWNETNLPFLNASMKQNLIYVDLTFTSQDRVQDFLNYFDQIDKALYVNPEKSEHQDNRYMVQFFQTLKNVFARANERVILYFIDKKLNFENVLKCLSYNPFGKYRFNYLKEFKQMTVIHSAILNVEDSDFNHNYQLITRIKFLKDVAICTFLEMSTQATLNEIMSRAHIDILRCLKNPKNQIIQKMKQLSQKNEEEFINVFCQIWQIFKAILEDSQTIVIKQMFYMKWIQSAMFSEVLSVFGRITKNREIQSFNPIFWQKLLQSMNPMLSYEWVDSQKIILNHQLNANREDTHDLMTSLVMLLAHCDSNTKILLLDFIRVQIEKSENRKSISTKYLSYIYRNFVYKSLQYCMNQEIIEKYIEFIVKIYIVQPVRTRHFIIESKFMILLKSLMENKFAFIMALKLLKIFIEVGNDDIFRYLLTINAYDCLKSKYAQNQKLQNIINSLFLSIFKSASEIRCKDGKRYLQKIFFSQNSQRDLEESKNDVIEKQNTFKREKPTSGLTYQFEFDKQINRSQKLHNHHKFQHE